MVVDACERERERERERASVKESQRGYSDRRWDEDDEQGDADRRRRYIWRRWETGEERQSEERRQVGNATVSCARWPPGKLRLLPYLPEMCINSALQPVVLIWFHPWPLRSDSFLGEKKNIPITMASKNKKNTIWWLWSIPLGYDEWHCSTGLPRDAHQVYSAGTWKSTEVLLPATWEI